MATLSEIVAAATSYSYMIDGRGVMGVVLAGPLGSVAAWDDGLVETEIDQDAAEAGSTPYWAIHTNQEQLSDAKAFIAACAAL